MVQAMVKVPQELPATIKDVLAGKASKPGRVQLLVEGTYLGQKFAEEYPIEVKPAGELAPRGWAEIAVASLLALNDPKLDELVTAYCQQFGIASRVASFLVLENVTTTSGWTWKKSAARPSVTTWAR